jgi:hypothetical protein
MKKRFYPKLLVVLLLFSLASTKSFSQTTYTWNQTGTADWTVASNWGPSPRTTPLPNDILQFNSGVTTTPINIPTETIGQLLISGNTIVNLQGATPGIVLTISGLTGTDLSITAGSELNLNATTNTTSINVATGATGVITGNMTFSNAAHRLDGADANSITFNNPSVFTQNAGCTGSVFNTTGTANTIVFSSGTTFVQNAGANPFGLVAPSSKVIFQTGSLFKIQQNSAPSFSGRTYANLEINSASFNQSPTGTNVLTIDNLITTLGTLNINLTTAGVNIKGNVTVAAGQTLTFTPASANTLTFNGTTTQSIANAGTLTFGANENITINNSNGLNINNNITWNNLVTFTSGVVTLPDTATLTLGASSSVASATNSSYVDGKVEKIGNTAFVFPVGKPAGNGFLGGYVPIAIENPILATITDSYIAKYLRTDANSLGPIGVVGLAVVSNGDYWTLNRTVTNPLSTVDVRLNWTNETSTFGNIRFITDLTKMVVAHNNGINWDNFGTTNTGAGTNSAGNVVWSPVSSFGNFALGSVDFSNLLPVTINYINGTRQKDFVDLSWQITCFNSSNVLIDLERAGSDKNFKLINNQTASALRCQQPFNYIDSKPFAGINYYRLKITDAGGRIKYSNNIAVINSTSGFDIVNLLPNVAQTDVTLNIAAAKRTKLNVTVTDIAGRPVIKTIYSLAAGSNRFDMSVSKLAAGLYYITGITAEGEVKTLRFVKQ